MGNIEVISIIVTIFLALIGYLVTYWNNVQISKRQEQLNLVNKRIEEFYGPLYVVTQAGDKTYASFLKKMGKKKMITDGSAPISEIEMAEWRTWMINVFMPLNEIMEKLVIEKAYLIQEEKMPNCLLDLVTHVSAYRAVISKWENNDFSENASTIEFPIEVREYAAQSYHELKQKQLKLIGKATRSIKFEQKYSV